MIAVNMRATAMKVSHILLYEPDHENAGHKFRAWRWCYDTVPDYVNGHIFFIEEKNYYSLMSPADGRSRLFNPGDWIVQDAAGELYPVDDSTFRATFNPINPAG